MSVQFVELYHTSSFFEQKKSKFVLQATFLKGIGFILFFPVSVSFILKSTFITNIVHLWLSCRSQNIRNFFHFLTSNWSKDIIINRFLDRFTAAKDKKYDDSFIWKIDSYFLSSFHHSWGHYRKIFRPVKAYFLLLKDYCKFLPSSIINFFVLSVIENKF